MSCTTESPWTTITLLTPRIALQYRLLTSSNYSNSRIFVMPPRIESTCPRSSRSSHSTRTRQSRHHPILHTSSHHPPRPSHHSKFYPEFSAIITRQSPFHAAQPLSASHSHFLSRRYVPRHRRHSPRYGTYGSERRSLEDSVAKQVNS
jgi:hypothetical protein